MKLETFASAKHRPHFGPTLTHSEAATEFGVTSMSLSNTMRADPSAPAKSNTNGQAPRYDAKQIRVWWGARKT